MKIESYATAHGVDADDKFIVTVHSRDTDSILLKVRIGNCTKFSVKVRDFVENEASKLNYNVVEWR